MAEKSSGSIGFQRQRHHEGLCPSEVGICQSADLFSMLAVIPPYDLREKISNSLRATYWFLHSKLNPPCAHLASLARTVRLTENAGRLDSPFANLAFQCG